MKVTLESTHKIVLVDGVQARVWEGATARGTPVIAFVTRLAVHNSQDHTEFDKELQECPPMQPSRDASAFDARLSLG